MCDREHPTHPNAITCNQSPCACMYMYILITFRRRNTRHTSHMSPNPTTYAPSHPNNSTSFTHGGASHPTHIAHTAQTETGRENRAPNEKATSTRPAWRHAGLIPSRGHNVGHIPAQGPEGGSNSERGEKGPHPGPGATRGVQFGEGPKRATFAHPQFRAGRMSLHIFDQARKTAHIRPRQPRPTPLFPPPTPP